MKSITIILSGDAYNPRTKGEIKKLLIGLDFSILGDGSFTGFIVESSSISEVTSKLGKYSKYRDITIEEDTF